MKRILVIGATSAIATAVARKWAKEQAQFFLVGRNREKLVQVAADLSVHGASSVATYILDLNHIEGHLPMIEACYRTLKQIDIALIAHGSLPDATACEKNVELALREFSSNGLSVIALLITLSQRMQEHRSGTIAVLSSVAGERGRPSNYLYGAAKAAVTTFCEGLRAKIHTSGVHVLTIKPGLVETPMTQGMTWPKWLMADPEKVAQDIVRAVEKRRDVIYTPRFWCFVMGVVKCIPSYIFKRLKF